MQATRSAAAERGRMYTRHVPLASGTAVAARQRPTQGTKGRTETPAAQPRWQTERAGGSLFARHYRIPAPPVIVRRPWWSRGRDARGGAERALAFAERTLSFDLRRVVQRVLLRDLGQLERRERAVELRKLAIELVAHLARNPIDGDEAAHVRRDGCRELHRQPAVTVECRVGRAVVRAARWVVEAAAGRAIEVRLIHQLTLREGAAPRHCLAQHREPLELPIAAGRR
mmetsp:Transcript_29082/g.77142  ORF Transcript_29082/g.77142 Transcript_29082/m.77142 type:complete len:228 (-) Transcript_29082:877-1560(-)